MKSIKRDCIEGIYRDDMELLPELSLVNTVRVCFFASQSLKQEYRSIRTAR